MTVDEIKLAIARLPYEARRELIASYRKEGDYFDTEKGLLFAVVDRHVVGFSVDELCMTIKVAEIVSADR